MKKWIRRSTCSIYGLFLRLGDFDNGTLKGLGYVCGLGYTEFPAILTDVGDAVKNDLSCMRYEDGLHMIRIIDTQCGYCWERLMTSISNTALSKPIRMRNAYFSL
jgi:hypothetical protein